MILTRFTLTTSGRATRGTVYVAVLGVTMIVAIMASVAMSLIRIERRIDEAHHDQQHARMYAHSVGEFVTNWINHEPNWRTLLIPNYEGPQSAFEQGTITWKAVDSDGSFTDDLRDNLRIEAIGRAGDSVVVEQVTLMPTGAPLSCLEVAVLSNGSIVLPSGSTYAFTQLNSDQIVGSNGNVNASNSNVAMNANVEAAGSTSGGGNITGTDTGNVALRELPNEDVFEYYKARGTWIPIESFALNGSNRDMYGKVLSPASNPYGATNPEGIYVVDCQGAVFQVRRSRVVGTLVLLNPGAGSGITNPALFEPAVANYPVLLVDGDLRLATSTIGLEVVSEALAGTSLNPPGTPFDGFEDTDTVDTLPSKLCGLVYANGVTQVTANSTIEGCLVTSELFINSSVRLQSNYESIYHEYPPPGFAKGDPMEIIPGSWKRVAY